MLIKLKDFKLEYDKKKNTFCIQNKKENRMLRIIFLIILNFTIFSQNITTYYKNNINEYIDTLKSRSHSTFYNLNGTWLFKTPNEIKWQRITIPSTYVEADKFLFKRNFKLSKKDRKNKVVLHILGINNEAVIKINGEAIFNYFYNGAPAQIELDKSKLYFEQRNTIEILVDNRLNYENSFPRKAIYRAPTPYGGITKDIFIESIPDKDIYDVSYHYTRKMLKLSFLENLVDSLAITTFNLNIFVSNGESSYQFSKKVYGDKVRNNTYRIDLVKEKPRRVDFNFKKDIRVSITGDKKIKKRTTRLKNYKYNFPVQKFSNKLHIISKVEQYKDKYNQADLAEIESDVNNILDLGFNAIFFPYDYPHPYYFLLAKEKQFKIFISLPLYSLTRDQYAKNATLAYIKNYKNLNHHKDAILVLPSISQNLNVEAIADSLKLSFYDGQKLQFKERTIFSSGYVQGEFKNYNGFQNEFSEEYQSKKFKDFIDQEKSNNHFLINTFSDFRTDISLLIQKRIGELNFSQTGLYTIDRIEKKSARDIKTLLNSNKELSLNPGDKYPEEEYSFIVLGIFALALFVIGFKQAVRLSDNLKRAFLHAHGFFTDTRERRILYMGQSFFLLFLFIIINGNILAAILFYNRENILFNILVNYVFTRETAFFILNLLDNPYYVQGFCIALILLLFIFMGIITKIIGSVVGRKTNFKQAMTTVVWSMTPVLFLIPVSMFLYNMLIFDMVNQYISYAVVIIYLWFFLRWLNGTRVISDSSQVKVLLFTLLLSVIFSGAAYGLLEYFRNLSVYLDYFNHLAAIQ